MASRRSWVRIPSAPPFERIRRQAQEQPHPQQQSFCFRYIHDNIDIYNPYSTFGAGRAVPVDPDLRNRPGYNIQIGWVDVIK